MGYYLYLIRSGNEQYAGVTKDIKERPMRHNAGENRSTKHRRGWKIAYLERFNTPGEARREETRIKKGKNFSKLTGRSAAG
ncbi:MAG: GIY-YIG nuclease family protein [Candidatus Omnitrophota bacterium]|nr:GIY-YIG nuclease family protein [Candidatus Omnitrophota bacterium]